MALRPVHGAATARGMRELVTTDPRRRIEMWQVRPHARAGRFPPLRAPPPRRYILLAKSSLACVKLSWSPDPGDRPSALQQH
jgi:hypothetical protein